MAVSYKKLWRILLDSDMKKALARQKPYYLVMCDSSMASDGAAANFGQIFESYSSDTVRRVL